MSNEEISDEVSNDLTERIPRLSIGRCDNGMYTRVDTNIHPELKVYSWDNNSEVLKVMLDWFAENGGKGSKPLALSLLSHLDKLRGND